MEHNNLNIKCIIFLFIIITSIILLFNFIIMNITSILSFIGNMLIAFLTILSLVTTINYNNKLINLNQKNRYVELRFKDSKIAINKLYCILKDTEIIYNDLKKCYSFDYNMPLFLSPKKFLIVQYCLIAFDYELTQDLPYSVNVLLDEIKNYILKFNEESKNIHNYYENNKNIIFINEINKDDDLKKMSYLSNPQNMKENTYSMATNSILIYMDIYINYIKKFYDNSERKMKIFFINNKNNDLNEENLFKMFMRILNYIESNNIEDLILNNVKFNIN